jgi:hypothetical protein
VSQQIVQIDVEKIRHNDVNGRNARGQGSRQIAIDLDGDELSDAGRERRGERPPAGTDLEERLVGASVERRYELCDPGRLEKMLAESLAGLPCAGSKGLP